MKVIYLAPTSVADWLENVIWNYVPCWWYFKHNHVLVLH